MTTIDMHDVELDHALDTPLATAIRIAGGAADNSMVPQTVFLSRQIGGGWMNLSFGSSHEREADHVFCTVIPAGYWANW